MAAAVPGLGVLCALAMITKRPALLHLSSQELQARMADIADAVGMAPEEVTPWVAKQPGLLELGGEALRSHVRRLCSALTVTPPGLLLILSRLAAPALTALLALSATQVGMVCSY